ncbi:MAG: ACP S-malonyltransferase [Puniceicoccales bacterium]|jgi:[acyl-carrier-protein] S-malonyltransferase|nr:ACP S-malonyltransferase [Puniceicoccales bacterium]
MKALLFSGQGAQKVGMGKSLYDNSPIAKEFYDRAENTLGFEFKKICFEGPESVLTETRVCQPALYVQGYVIAEILKSMGKLDGLKAALGLSLGELTAYAFAGVWDFETGLKIVAERGRLMQVACDATKGGMAAVVGGTIEDVRKLCAAYDIDVANMNCPGQIVISGDYNKVNEAAANAKSYGSFKLVKPLVVAGAYHSRLMEPARAAFEKFLAPIEFKAPKLTVFTNTTGKEINDPAAMKAALVKQVVSSVLWEDCLRGAVALGCTDFYECGPGAVLAGMMKRTDANAKVTSISEFAEFPA